jgi:spore coat protein SA
MLRQPPVDIAHLHADFGLAYLPRSVERIVHLHGVPGGSSESYHHILTRVGAVVCSSEYVRDSFLSKIEYDSRRTFMVYNGAEEKRVDGRHAQQTRQELGLSQSDICILFVGALVPEKGIHHLIDAFKKLNASKPHGKRRNKLVIVGGAGLWRHQGASARRNADYEAKLRAEAHDIDAIFTGLKTHTEVSMLYNASDIVVVPSVVQEAFGLVVCEAMAAGKPVIASSVGGIPEVVIHGHSGLLVPAGDVGALARAMLRLASDRDLREAMGRAARERARAFTWDAAADRTEEVYKRVLNREI